MKTKMNIVRKNMFARDLKDLIDLPNYDNNQRVEITIKPVAENKILSEEEIDAITDRLTGCLKGVNPTKTLDDWRTERLAERYGIAY